MSIGQNMQNLDQKLYMKLVQIVPRMIIVRTCNKMEKKHMQGMDKTLYLM